MAASPKRTRMRVPRNSARKILSIIFPDGIPMVKAETGDD